MPLPDVEVGNPADVPHRPPLLPALVLPVSRLPRLVVVRHAEGHVPGVVPEPHLVPPDEREGLLVLGGALRRDDHERLLMLDKRRDVLPYQRERRVRHNDVGLVEERHTLGAAKVAAPLKQLDGVLAGAEQLGHVQHVDTALAGHVADGRHDGLVRRAPLVIRLVAEQGQLRAGYRRPGITGRYELLELELVEVEREVLEEIRLVGIVAVAQNGLALEVGAVVPQLVLDVGELGVELVLLGVLCFSQCSVLCHFPSLCIYILYRMYIQSIYYPGSCAFPVPQR